MRWNLFTNIKDSFLINWDALIEWYLLKVDSLTSALERQYRVSSARFMTFSEKPETQKKLLKLTFAGLIITFTFLLFSCQTLPTRSPGAPLQARRFDSSKPERELNQLYLKNDEVIVKNREFGSSTGSIWADSHEPRALLTDPAPNKEGQTITVNIPPELQFDPKTVVANENAKLKDKKSSDKSKKEQSDNDELVKLTDPDSISPSLKMTQTPIKSLKMQIVGFEPGGDVYLRGTRQFMQPSGEESTTMILAKVPRRVLTSYELDARELTDVAINEDTNGRQKEYSAPGWDEVVSRRLAGFSPDLKSELEVIDGLREEIRTSQTALREQAKANEAERERIRKERERMAAQTGTANSNDPSTKPAAQQVAGDGKNGGQE